ncbi:MAG: tail fiber domain-containing protein, partial [Xanthomonadales bacterium]|nr:tail fiber domain-containing protein [Xanthomonadales bacterium]
DHRALYTDAGLGYPVILSNHALAANPTIRFRDANTQSDTMVVDIDAQRVGIGTSNPATALEVIDTYAHEAGQLRMRRNQLESTYGWMGSDVNSFYIGANNVGDTGRMSFRIGNEGTSFEAMRINSPSAPLSEPLVDILGSLEVDELNIKLIDGRTGRINGLAENLLISNLAGGFIGFGTSQTPGSAPVRLFLANTGWVGIGTASPEFLLHVDGSAGKPGGGSWSVASDRDLKKNIDPLSGSLDQLLQLRGVTFEYRDPEAIGEHSGERIGMIAQEVEPIFPDWVEERGDGYKSVTFRGFEALTVEAFRDLRAEKDAEIASLRAENARLSRELASLKNQGEAHWVQFEERLRQLETKGANN